MDRKNEIKYTSIELIIISQKNNSTEKEMKENPIKFLF